MEKDIITSLLRESGARIVLLVMDGLGGLPLSPGGKTELEAARTPNLDQLASRGICGLHEPVATGITPGSGPAHLGLFGYDPIRYQVGRGVLAALGIGFNLKENDVAARGNFCTIDKDGVITDRRAGRIGTDRNHKLCEVLRQIDLPGVDIFVETVKEYRFLLVLRGDNLDGRVADTDPQKTDEKPVPPKPQTNEARHTAELIGQFVDKARSALAGHSPANMILLRGFSQHPNWPDFTSRFGLRAAAIAAYPMYRGVAKLIGMNVLETGDSLDEELDTLRKNWNDFDFFYVHVKKVDSYGEDGNFDKKVSLIEEVDKHIPRILDLKPEVVIVTGDHSTPCRLKSHSWHPVPVLLWSEVCRTDSVQQFGERPCMNGGLGCRFPAAHLMRLALSNAGRLEKYGA